MYSEFESWLPEFASIRHYLHANPELAFEEVQTSAYLVERLKEYGVDDIETGWAKTGIVATIHGQSGAANDLDKVIALRSDIDALPLLEQTDLPYASKTHGKMHACGHDGHMATLLMAAKYLAQHRNFSGTVKLIFQPAEESGGGANVMIKQGLFDKHPVKSVWGMHNWPGIPLGIALAKHGAMMAACDEFDITIKGVGGHAAYPHTTRDPLHAGAQLVVALQSIVSRNVEPTSEAVLTVTAFNIGQTHNVIEDTAELMGTIRSYDPEIRIALRKRVQEVCDGIALAHGVTIELNLMHGYPATINSKHEFDIAHSVLQSIVPHIVTEFKPSMGAEDFAYMLEKVPGCYIGLGTGVGDDDPGLHDPRFDFNDAALPIGATYWVKLVESILPA